MKALNFKLGDYLYWQLVELNGFICYGAEKHRATT